MRIKIKPKAEDNKALDEMAEVGNMPNDWKEILESLKLEKATAISWDVKNNNQYPQIISDFKNYHNLRKINMSSLRQILSDEIKKLRYDLNNEESNLLSKSLNYILTLDDTAFFYEFHKKGSFDYLNYGQVKFGLDIDDFMLHHVSFKNISENLKYKKLNLYPDIKIYNYLSNTKDIFFYSGNVKELANKIISSLKLYIKRNKNKMREIDFFNKSY